MNLQQPGRLGQFSPAYLSFRARLSFRAEQARYIAGFAIADQINGNVAFD